MTEVHKYAYNPIAYTPPYTKKEPLSLQRFFLSCICLSSFLQVNDLTA